MTRILWRKYSRMVKLQLKLSITCSIMHLIFGSIIFSTVYFVISLTDKYYFRWEGHGCLLRLTTFIEGSKYEISSSLELSLLRRFNDVSFNFF
jgi:hypothetical protein